MESSEVLQTGRRPEKMLGTNTLTYFVLQRKYGILTVRPEGQYYLTFYVRN